MRELGEVNGRGRLGQSVRVESSTAKRETTQGSRGCGHGQTLGKSGSTIDLLGTRLVHKEVARQLTDMILMSITYTLWMGEIV